MHDFNHNNKVTGVRYVKNNIENLIVKVTLKPKHNIVSLPKFEEFNHSNDLTDSTSQEYYSHHEENQFKWQEKVFNAQELDYYSNKQNCNNEHEEYYYELTKNEPKCNKIFTYITEDNFSPIPFEKATEDDKNKDSLESCFRRLNLNERLGFNKNSESTRDLLESEGVVNRSEKWSSMHVMFDNSRYNEELQLTLKQETVLVSLYWNSATGCLILKPDENSLEWNPYLVESSSGVTWNYEYAVKIEFEGESDNGELRNLIKKLQKKWDKRHRSLKEFKTPSVGVIQYHVTVEILTAQDFENDDLYIDYTIKLPDWVICKNQLEGRTNLAKNTVEDDQYVWKFSHILELEMECTIEKAIPKTNLYLEIISQDWWGRLRTEGYTHFLIPLEPGRESCQLSCMRPDEADRMTAEDRRFFIGGCHLLEDLDVLSTPQDVMNPNYKFTTTGSVSLRYQVIKQTPSSTTSISHGPGTSSSSALLSGADAVLRQYKRARARLAAATEGLGAGDGHETEET